MKFQTAGYERRFADEKAALDAERSRVLYVALTRAADLLVLPIVVGEPPAGSLQARWQAVAPVDFAATEGQDDDSATGPAVDDTDVRPADFVRVVTWAAGAARTASAPPPPPTADALSARETWRVGRATLLARASRTAPIYAPSALERLEPPDWVDGSTTGAPPVGSAAAAAAPSGDPAATGAVRRPGGREHALALGTAVHAVLERVSLDDDGGLAELAVVAASQAGIAGESGTVAGLAHACWRAAPLRAAARRPHRRELPVCVQHGEVLIEGALDLVYRDDELGGWIVVDYKTDAHPIPATVRERYGGQAGAYALAFEVAVGEPVLAVCVLLASLPDAAGAATVVRLECDRVAARSGRDAPARGGRRASWSRLDEELGLEDRKRGRDVELTRVGARRAGHPAAAYPSSTPAGQGPGRRAAGRRAGAQRAVHHLLLGDLQQSRSARRQPGGRPAERRRQCPDRP